MSKNTINSPLIKIKIDLNRSIRSRIMMRQIERHVKLIGPLVLHQGFKKEHQNELLGIF